MSREALKRCFTSSLIALVLTLAGTLTIEEGRLGSRAVEAAVLEEVTVTARRREENLFDVPETIISFGEQKIETQRINTLKDFGLFVPNVGSRNDLSPTSTFISVRGITATRNTDPAVAIVVDGVVAASASVTRQELFDIEQIEVLKGPQGALYGRNALGGAINIVTKKPSNEWTGKVSVGYGNANRAESNFAISGPLIEDELFFRISGSYRDDDGTILNTSVGKDVDFETSRTLRTRFIWEPNERFSADVRASIDDLETGTYYYTITRPIGDPFQGEDRNSNTFSNLPASNPISVADSEIVDLSLKLDYEFDFATLTSITAYNYTYELYGEPGQGVGRPGPGDLDFTNADIIGNEQSYNPESISQEFRLISNDESARLRWNVGFYYIDIDREDTLPIFDDADADGDLTDEFVSTGGKLFPLGTERNIRGIAVFGNVDYDIFEQLTASFGLRYDEEDRDQLDLDDPNPATNFQEETFDAFQPKVSLTYRANDNQMFYGTVSRGFRSGGFNTPRSPFPTTFNKETLWSYEVGHKGRYLDNTLQLNAAFFYEDITDKQNFTFDVLNAAQILYNIPESEVYGIEVDGSWAPTDGLTIGFAGGWMDSEISDFEFAPFFPVNNSAPIGNSSGLTLPVTNSYFEGNKLPNFSHWSFTLSGDYTYPLDLGGAAWEALFHMDYSVRGKNYWDVFNTDIEKDVNVVNARVGIENEHWNVSLWVENLTNSRYWTNWFNQNDTALPDIGFFAPERRFGATITYSF